MNYILKHFVGELLKFSADENSSNTHYKIAWINRDNEYVISLDFKATPEGLVSWIRNRIISKNRAYTYNFPAKCGFNINRPMNVILVSKGLLLNDCYWMVEEGFEGSFKKYNLYENNFNRVLAHIAFFRL